MSNRFLRALCAAALSLPLAAGMSGCDPSESTPSSTALTITPSLGLVRNATVVVKNSAGAVVGNGTTGTTGVVSVTATGAGPFVIEIQGDSDAEYFDENTGTFLPFPAPRVMHAIVPTGTTNVGVTGLTELAHSLWAANGVPLSNANINAANGAVLSALASTPLLSSILTPPTVISAPPTAGSLGNNAGDAYAAILAALAELGSGASAPALEAIDQLRRDVADGSIDGQDDGTPITGLLYPNTGFAAHFQNRVDNRISALGTAALQSTTFTISTISTPSWTGTTGGGGGGGGTGTAATVNPALAGVYNLTYFQSAAGGPFTDGQVVQVTVSSSGMLLLPSVTLNSPFYRAFGGTDNLHEVIWLDSAAHIEYALTDNITPEFSEINVGDASHPDSSGIPRFLGQLRLPPTGPDFSPLQALAGSYNLVVTQKSGTISSVSPALNQGDSFAFNIDATGAISSARINRTFDPMAAGTTYQNSLNTLEPSLELAKVIGDNGTPSDTSDDPVMGFRVYIEDGVLVAAKLSETKSCGSGCSSTATITFEARPINTLHQDFINDLLSAISTPQTFTVISRTSTFAFLPVVCTQIPVSASAGPTTGAPPLRLTINSFTQNWEASFARVSGNDALRTLKLYLFNVKLDDMGNVRLEERQGNNVVAVATNSAAEIAAASCAP